MFCKKERNTRSGVALREVSNVKKNNRLNISVPDFFLYTNVEYWLVSVSPNVSPANSFYFIILRVG